MAFNMYTQLPRVKEYLSEKGYTKDIPVDVFWQSLMILFGMKRRTAENWVRNFNVVDLIVVKEGLVNFV